MATVQSVAGRTEPVNSFSDTVAPLLSVWLVLEGAEVYQTALKLNLCIHATGLLLPMCKD